MKRYVCIHGHFYQPPRENPWLEAIELQDSAWPFHDWNERITAECYAVNAASRILDGDGRIARIVNNYAQISFNFGPTLLSWMQHEAPEVYAAIQRADRESMERFSGHGSALAQGYNHAILPLCNERDQQTQVIWGIRDFEFRFGRKPEGMWLPETAADTATLEVLAEHGIDFTVLAPRQARRIRQPGGRWHDVHGGIDPSRAYRCNLPSGRSIALFFYDGPVSQAVAFEHLLSSGERLAHRLVGTFHDSRDWPQLAHIATDGETYGHHFRHGEMALAYALHYIEQKGLARLTNYGEYLELQPPTVEVEIHEKASWSCAHGVERWRSDCGCNTGRPEWRQGWREPLRDVLDWLRDELAPRYEAAASELVSDPWAARDDYVDVVLDRSPDRVDAFLGRHAHGGDLDPQQRVRLWKLLELQRHAMLMYTSCGWFFDELSGLETVQVLQYAGRAVQLARDLFGDDLETPMMKRLEDAPSNVPEHGNGRAIWENMVRPSMVDLHRVAAHYAVSFPFSSLDRTHVYGFPVTLERHHLVEAGRARLGVGRIRITSDVTHEHCDLEFGVVYLGDHNVLAGVRPSRDEDAYETMAKELRQAFSRADLPAAVRLVDRHFGTTYDLQSLFWDEQRRIVDTVLVDTLGTVEGTYRHIYEQHAPLMRFLVNLHQPIPPALETAAVFVLNAVLRRAIVEGDLERQRTLLAEARSVNVTLDARMLGHAFTRVLDAAMRRFEDSLSLQDLDRALALARFANEAPYEVDRWTSQNICWRMRDARKASRAKGWAERFRHLGEQLGIDI